VAAYGRDEPLQAGMQVEANVFLDRRRLIEWVFEPLFSLAGRA
jgi:membrane fusion protein